LVPLDFYAILGVLPEAEDVVVRAAYRALAQRYHPDKWTGSASEAHRRMTEINVAFESLGNPEKRKAYDESWVSSNRADFSAADDYSEVFSSALDAVEERWRIACGIFPDLIGFRARLDNLAPEASFAFVTSLLESKLYAKRAEICSQIERVFLERYFGSNPRITEFASLLFSAQQRPALRALNRMVDVLGTEVDPALIISKINSEFSLGTVWKSAEEERAKNSAASTLAQRLAHFDDFDAALELSELHGCTVRVEGQGLFKPAAVDLHHTALGAFRFQGTQPFVAWVKTNLCGN
jgi:curved DNA-binding protein CbpA